MKKMISVIVPVKNEQDNISPFYERMKSVFLPMDYDWEVIFIDDGSNDHTLEVINNLADGDARIKAIVFSRNFGKEMALTAGLDYAIGDACIPIDVDLQDPPELIPAMIAKWNEGFDVVYATRKSRRGESIVKKATAFLFYRMIRKMTSIDIPADTGDFRLMDRRVVDELKNLRERRRFMKGLFSWVGFKQTSIEYERDPRFAGETKFNFWKLFVFAIEGITSFSFFPLQIATWLGFLVAFFAFVYAVILIAKEVVFNIPVPPGYPSIMVTMLFLGGVQLICMGVIGEYIGRLYDESKRRPLYIVSERIGIEKKSYEQKHDNG